ncbi:LacI family DNA-binding transcriptional regulator [Foetidibacter luteolus]|uniref:LacI family DNA-binding transcriptional regulator n=1 Tax=Foetidibacter luteolus TaxID=2608880 RepID=UPI00129A10E4|nr:substrate-binding domain-containing protein [Foetidibacter luteolus]
MKKISIKDIARLTGTSPTTVSFVLNGRAKEMRISAAIAKKILATTKKYGYKPNAVAVSLRTGQSKIIGLIVESIGGAFFGALARVIEAEAEKHGYRIVYCSTENNVDKARGMIDMLSHQLVDGYLITPVNGIEKDVQELVQHGKPVVMMDGYLPGINIPYVLVDNYEGVKSGMEHLIANGYKNIGFVSVDLDLVQLKERWRGYTETLKLHKLKQDKKLVLKLGYQLQKEEVINAITAYLLNNKKMDAVFFATNYLGVSGLQAIKNAGLQIPSDIAVICFDDHEIFGLYPPGITSIRQPVEDIAHTAMNLLLSHLTKKEAAEPLQKIQVQASFVQRGSTPAKTPVAQ